MNFDPAPHRRVKRSEYDSDVSASLQPKRAKRIHGPPLTSLFTCSKWHSASTAAVGSLKPRTCGGSAVKQPLSKERDSTPPATPSRPHGPMAASLIVPDPQSSLCPSKASTAASDPSELPKGPPITYTSENEMENHDKKTLTPGNVQRWNATLDAMLRLSIGKLDATSSVRVEGYWPKVAQNVPGKSGRQCRERWVCHLDPNLAHDEFTDEERNLMFEIYGRVGGRWACVAGHLNNWRMSKGLKGVRSNSFVKNAICRHNGTHNGPPKPVLVEGKITEKDIFYPLNGCRYGGDVNASALEPMSIVRDLRLALTSPPAGAPEYDTNTLETRPMSSPPDRRHYPVINIKILPRSTTGSLPRTRCVFYAEPFRHIGSVNRRVNFDYNVAL